MIGNLKEMAKDKATQALENAPIPTDLILSVLGKAPGPMKIGELAEATGLDKSIVDKAIKALKKSGQITSPERCKYSVV